MYFRTLTLIIMTRTVTMRLFLMFFFFSSRRRHTRLQGDWSSDVCSSDLRVGGRQQLVGRADELRDLRRRERRADQVPLGEVAAQAAQQVPGGRLLHALGEDRESTRLNSSHLVISYAVFFFKKKKSDIDGH